MILKEKRSAVISGGEQGKVTAFLPYLNCPFRQLNLSSKVVRQVGRK
jgi:hypothetical protein